jgi:hypothetical protein
MNTSQPSPVAVLSEYASLFRIIGYCPNAGSGVHSWIFLAALRLKHLCDEKTACATITRAVARCGREVTESEIRDAVSSARNAKAGRGGPKWPCKNDSLIHAAAQNGFTVAKLRELSPVKAGDLRTGQIVNKLFPGHLWKGLLCVGKDKNKPWTAPKLVLSGIAHQMQFIVPNPMSALRGGRKSDGSKSRRCLDNTGSRRFLVVESDPARWGDLTGTEKSVFGSEENYIAQKKDEAAAVLWHLSKIAPLLPLVMVVDSAGKSLHGWVYAQGVSEKYQMRFMRYAVALGADPATWTRCQFVRMPGGRRDNGKRQTVIYFNPKPVEAK